MNEKKYVILSEDDVVKEPERLADWDDRIYRVGIYSVSKDVAKDFANKKIDMSTLMDEAYNSFEEGFYKKSFDEAGQRAVEFCKENGYVILMKIFLDVETGNIIKRTY